VGGGATEFHHECFEQVDRAHSPREKMLAIERVKASGE